MMKFLKYIFVAVIVESVAFAGFLRVPYEGLRPTGMGNAYIAIADDENALWYNPAGLARQTGTHINLIDFTMGVDSLPTFNRVKGALLDGQTDDVLVYGGNQYLRMGTAPSIITKYFGFALYENLNMYLELADLELPNVDMYFANDIGAIAGFGIPFGKNVSFGASLRMFQRTGLDSIITPSQLLSQLGLNQTDLSSALFEHLKTLTGLGWAFGVNLGTLVEIPLPAKSPKWTVAGTIEDVLGTKFRSIGANTVPNSIPASYHLGTALEYPYKKNQSIRLSLDGRNLFVGHPLYKSLHLGGEVELPLVDFRLGAYQGYLTGGLTLKPAPHTQITFSTYAVELGNSLWERSQRWYLLQLTIGFRPL